MSTTIRRFVLILDESIPAEAVMIVALDCLEQMRAMQLKDEQSAASHQNYTSHRCPGCDRTFGADDPRNAQRALSAHIRQIHRNLWLNMQAQASGIQTAEHSAR